MKTKYLVEYYEMDNVCSSCRRVCACIVLDDYPDAIMLEHLDQQWSASFGRHSISVQEVPRDFNLNKRFLI